MRNNFAYPQILSVSFIIHTSRLFFNVRHENYTNIAAKVLSCVRHFSTIRSVSFTQPDFRRYNETGPKGARISMDGKKFDKNTLKTLVIAASLLLNCVLGGASYTYYHHLAEQILFVDGWIGKGAILGELQKDVAPYSGVSSELAVVADPANITELCGTHHDLLIPSSCLNCTVSGLISRTFLRDDIIGKEDFHGAVYYGELEKADLSHEFLKAIEKEFVLEVPKDDWQPQGHGIDEVRKIAGEYGIDNINLIKPGIGETTRVLLRRVPWKILVNEKYKEDASLEHILRLVEEKEVPVEWYPLEHYKACGLIKKVADA